MNYVEKYNSFICATLGTGWNNSINAYLLLRINHTAAHCNGNVNLKEKKSVKS